MEKGELIAEILDRGVSAIYPSREFLKKKLEEGGRLKIYFGIDPTGSSLHIGHAISLMKLSVFQKLGHEVVMLIGDTTATIGDPTGKLSARKTLSREEVLANCARYKEQAAKLLDFDGENKVKIEYNSSWLGKINLPDILKYASALTVDQLLERDMFQERKKANKPIFLHEFMYPLLQGYDSVAMAVDGEIGGNDQTFNMLTGRDLVKSFLGKEKFVLTCKLLEDSSGKKMGKTTGNTVDLSESADEMFGKIMSWPDEIIFIGMEMCTRLSINEIKTERNKVEDGGNPRDSKLLLATEVVKIYHGAESAEKSKARFLETFSQKVLPTDLPEIKIQQDELLSDVLLRAKIISSKSEFQRLVDEGAVKNEQGDKINEIKAKANSGTYKIGKHRFVKIIQM